MYLEDHRHLELIETCQGAWRVCDSRVPDEDALHVVAFIESDEESVEVVWVRGSIIAPGRFETLDAAVDAIEDLLTTGELRSVPVSADR